VSRLTENKQPLSEAGIILFYWRVIVRPHLWQAVAIGTLMLCSSGLEMVTIGLSIPLIEAVSQMGEVSGSWVLVTASTGLEFLGLPTDGNLVVLALLSVAVLLFVLSGAMSLLHQFLTAAIGYRLRRDTRSALFRRFLYARYADVTERDRGKVLHDISVPSETVFLAIRWLGVMSTAIFNTVLMLALMVYLSWPATVLIGAFLVFGVQGTRKVIDHRVRKHGRTIYELQGDETKLEVDAIDGLKVVKAQALETTIVGRHRQLLVSEIGPSLQVAMFRYAPGFVQEAAAAVIVLILAGMSFLVPSVGMTFPTLVAFLLAIRRTGPAVANINATLVELNTARRSVETIEEVLHQMPTEVQNGRKLTEVREVRFEAVGFSYGSRSERPAVNDINFVLKRGTVSAFVGSTGAGKSTIADLAVGLYVPETGRILIDGVDLKDINIGDWRTRIGYVTQDAFLFNASIRDNIALWDESVHFSDVETTARMAGLQSFMETLSEGYDTMVGDRGLKLSGGQRQRIAIARAILHRPEVLIFDEATSALDNKTEKSVYDDLYALRKNSIVFVIAHRLSTIREADQILVLSSGRVVERGSHDSLMALRGAYAKLYEVECN
jgi:ABC-type multidrug transport system fused ATPase/permease subunit